MNTRLSMAGGLGHRCQIRPGRPGLGMALAGLVMTAGSFLSPSAARAVRPGKPFNPTALTRQGPLPDYDVRSANGQASARQDTYPLAAYWGGPARLLSRPPTTAHSDPADFLLTYLAGHLAPIGPNAAALHGARYSRRFVSGHNGLTHLTFQQQHRGLDLLGCSLRVSVTADGRLVSISSTLLNPVRPTNETERFLVAPSQAAKLALQAAGVLVFNELHPGDQPVGKERRQTFGLVDGSASDIQVRRVYFPIGPQELRPAWEVVVPDGDSAGRLVMDAGDGTLLQRRHRRQTIIAESITLGVFASDSPAPGSPGLTWPTGQQNPFTSAEALTVLPQDISAQSPAGWIPDGTNYMSGNNVDAHLDRDGNDVADLPLIEGASYRIFDFASSHPDQHPFDYSDASVAQLFHICNVFHDRLYALGFDEAAHNFQFDNLGGPGQAGDGIQADAQDNVSANVASFTTGPQDGSATRLEAHLFLGPTVPRDSAFERDLIYHELTHGLSVRLLESLPTGSQPQALSEGWSDFLAIALNAQPSDDPHAPYPFAPYIAYRFWAGYTDNYYFGLRRYPYSTDLNLAPLTYADIDPARLVYPPGPPRNQYITTPADQRHNAGEVWGNTLLECRAALMDRYGFAGNQMMMQLLVDGMMLGPANPNFLQARDAILNADLVDHAGANLDVLWPAFAKRGLGASAQSPGNGVSDVIEAFDVPDLLVFAYPDGLPQTAPPNQDLTFSVAIRSVGNAVPQAGTAWLHYTLDGDTLTSAPLSPTGPDQYQATLPPAGCPSAFQFYFTVDDSNLGTFTDPLLAPSQAFQAMIALNLAVAFQDDMELDTGWSVNAAGDDDATKGLWTRMDPQGTTQYGAIVQPEDDRSFDPGVTCWVTDGRAGDTASALDVDGGKTTLTSPIISIAGDDAMISYWRWFSNDAGPSPNEDTLVVEISNDGGAQWFEVETIGPTGPDTSGGWAFHEFLVSQVVAPSNTVQLRFIASDTLNGSLVEAAIDDVTVTSLQCTPSPQGDATGDGVVDLQDYPALLSCFSGPNVVPLTDPDGCLETFDFDGDTDVDSQDFAGFQSAFESP